MIDKEKRDIEEEHQEHLYDYMYGVLNNAGDISTDGFTFHSDRSGTFFWIDTETGIQIYATPFWEGYGIAIDCNDEDGDYIFDYREGEFSVCGTASLDVHSYVSIMRGHLLKCRELVKDVKRKIPCAVRSGLNAFWDRISKSFPEAKTGDLSPNMTNALDNIAEVAVEEWVKFNVKGSK